MARVDESVAAPAFDDAVTDTQGVGKLVKARQLEHRHRLFHGHVVDLFFLCLLGLFLRLFSKAPKRRIAQVLQHFGSGSTAQGCAVHPHGQGVIGGLVDNRPRLRPRKARNERKPAGSEVEQLSHLNNQIRLCCAHAVQPSG